MGISLKDLDLIDVDFLIELIEERNLDLDHEEVVEATPEMMKKFF